MTDPPGARLLAVHEKVLDEPLPEWLEEAPCGPGKHLAHLALRASEAGQTAEQWRVWGQHSRARGVAEQCMHAAGLWPWRDT